MGLRGSTRGETRVTETKGRGGKGEEEEEEEEEAVVVEGKRDRMRMCERMREVYIAYIERDSEREREGVHKLSRTNMYPDTNEHEQNS